MASDTPGASSRGFQRSQQQKQDLASELRLNQLHDLWCVSNPLAQQPCCRGDHRERSAMQLCNIIIIIITVHHCSPADKAKVESLSSAAHQCLHTPHPYCFASSTAHARYTLYATSSCMHRGRDCVSKHEVEGQTTCWLLPSICIRILCSCCDKVKHNN